MIAAEDLLYRELELDSSNELMEFDADRGMGRDVRAALHARNAGLARARMAEIQGERSNFVASTEDFLSAAECFYSATDPMRMRLSVERARARIDLGDIQDSRRDLLEAVEIREGQLALLCDALNAFWRSYTTLVGATRESSDEALAYLIEHVSNFPGSPHLHAEISWQAARLCRRELALQSLEVAFQFDPSSPELAALKVSLLFELDDAAEAARVGRELLITHPNSHPIRLLAARAIAFRGGRVLSERADRDWQEALEILEPLLATPEEGSHEQRDANQLAIILRRFLGSWSLTPSPQEKDLQNLKPSLPNAELNRLLEEYHPLHVETADRSDPVLAL